MIIPRRIPAWSGSSNSAASSSGAWPPPAAKAISPAAGALGAVAGAQKASATVLIGNIPHDADEDELREIFSLMGAITFFELVKDSATGASKGCAICDFAEPTSAKDCAQNMNAFDFHGKPLRVAVVDAGIKSRVLGQTIKPVEGSSGLTSGQLQHLRSLAQAQPQASTLAAGSVLGGRILQPALTPIQPAGVPPEFVEQLKRQMEQAEGQTGKACRFGKTCKSIDCPNIHAEGRDIMDDPASLVCRFGRRCMRSGCFYVHPAGRDLDEDPAKGMCKDGAQCPRPDCYFKHPDTRNPVIQVRCFNCKQFGHISKECTQGKPPTRGHVWISEFPEEWTSSGDDFLLTHIRGELEVFGELAQHPEVLGELAQAAGGGKMAMAIFNDINKAKEAVQALNGVVFKIEFRETPELGPGGVDKSCTVFIGNIPYDATEDTIRDWFCDVGVVVGVRLVREKDSQVLKGYGFVDFETKENADDAIQKKHNMEFKGRQMRVTSADHKMGDPRAKRERDQGPRRNDANCTLEISDFPQRWTESDMSDFLRGALKGGAAALSVTIETTGGLAGDEPPKALVSFPCPGDARKAAQDLKAQKIAGKLLRVYWAGAGTQDDLDGEGGSKWDDWEDRGNKGYDRNGERDGGRERKERRRPRDEHVLVCLHLDELAMLDRPQVEPAPDDCEVWVDPLPDDDMLGEWIASFGKEIDVYRIPDPETGEPGDRGYIRFEKHESAQRCVASGSGTWSESERTLSSQVSRRGGRDSSYPESFVALLLGPKGETIRRLKEEMGASMLSLRGEGLGENDKMSSKRVHFVCKGNPEAIEKMQSVLEAGVAKLHLEMKDKIENGVPKGRQRAREADNDGRSKRRRSRSRRRDKNEPPPFVPPPGWDPYAHPPPGYYPGYWPPPPGYGPPPGYPPGHPPPHHWPPPPGYGPPPGYPPPPPGEEGDFPPGYHGGMFPPPPGPPPLHEGSSDDFLAQLPPHISPAEEALQDAVLTFLENWEGEHPEGVNAKLIHLGGDPRVRDCKADALPREVPLKSWIRHRLHHQVTIEAQTVKLIPGANLDRVGPPAVPRHFPHPPPGFWPHPPAHPPPSEHWLPPPSSADDDRPPGYHGDDDVLNLLPEDWDPNDEIDAIWGAAEPEAFEPGLRPEGDRGRERSRRRGRRHRRRAPPDEDFESDMVRR
mmetsp:Transcript_24183/g.38633  ORF Transcript_24183/g.38633 Transcript_24183/m.38633 type:complete len:1173 (-) Transcript_24183:10-3528(-)